LKSIDVYALGKKYFKSYSISKIYIVAIVKAKSSVLLLSFDFLCESLTPNCRCTNSTSFSHTSDHHGGLH
jgi:hypothetical protein